MAECCSSFECKAEPPKKHRCPANGVEYTEVSARTISHHIKHSWNWSGKGRRYYFCDDPECDVVYFGDDDSVIPKSQLRTHLGVKDSTDDALVCYCFGVTKSDARSDPGIRNFVVAQTKLGLCSCDTRNPSGRCCLIDFPRCGDSDTQ
jgi:Zinc binding domain